MIRLNVGCGEFSAPGWLNIDTWAMPPVKPDVRASALAIPLADASCVAIYAGHVMEHLTLAEVPKALAEFRRVLVPGGKLLIVGPDIERARNEKERRDIVEGAQRWPGDTHAWTSRVELMRSIVEEAGWQCRECPIERVPREWPVVARVHWQFVLECRGQTLVDALVDERERRRKAEQRFYEAQKLVAAMLVTAGGQMSIAANTLRALGDDLVICRSTTPDGATNYWLEKQ